MKSENAVLHERCRERKAEAMSIARVCSSPRIENRSQSRIPVEREEKFPAHMLAMMWLAMIVGCLWFWGAVLRFLLSGF